jgi:hypothetical protein
MPLLRHLRPAAWVAFAFAGCADPTGPAPGSVDPPVVTGASSYTLERLPRGWAGQIDFSFTNVTSRTISLLNCHGGFALRLEKDVDGAWVPAWHPVLFLCLSPPIVIPPGEAHEHVVHVFGGDPESNAYPQFQMEEIDGTYRLVITSAYWDYDHSGPDWGEAPPLELRVSGPFEIRTER